jgi:outer membrane protein assembly factor BamA
MKLALRIALSIGVLVFTMAAQKRTAGGKPSPDSSTKLISFKVAGTSRYMDKEILAASGLQIGRPASDGDFKEAVQRLGEFGVFSDAAYSFSTSDTGTKLEIQLSDVEAGKLVPARFENFVWFSDAKLLSEVRKNVPLFKGLLPLTGNLPDRVSEALRALLSENQLPGHVDFLRSTDANSSSLTEIIYQVELVSIRIESVEFPGASAEHTALLESASRKLIGEEYGRSTFEAAAKFDLLPVYFQRGYLKAQFGEASARVIHASSEDAKSADDRRTDSQGTPEVRVVAILPVNPGNVYLSSGVDVQDNSAMKTDEIVALLHLNAGQPANSVRLARDTENVVKLYRSRGYITASLKAEPSFDDSKQTVHYTLNIAEGGLYTMGELEVQGLDNQTKAKAQAEWKLAEGQPYNAEYKIQFVKDIQRLIPNSDWDIKVEETPDARDKTVDVTLRFKRR